MPAEPTVHAHTEAEPPPTVPLEEPPPEAPETAAKPDPATEQAPAAALSFKLPEIPGYDVVRLLGRGGMGQVFLAFDRKLERQVALKMLGGWAANDPRLFERFQTEIKAVARLAHPNIAQVYEAGEADGQPWFTMEFVPGGSLAERLSGRPLPPLDAAALVETLARAMHHAHQQGVLHRDLKPANILLGAASQEPLADKNESSSQTAGGAVALGSPRITDFGLAKRLDSQSGQTKSGEVLGTPSYMAPEQASGVTLDVGPECDVYQLGAILYECLTGRPPFLAPDPFATVMQVMTEDPAPPRRIQPGVPRDLETICLKCLAKTPAKRYRTAHALADDLHRYLAAKPIHARPTPWWERFWKWARRHPALALLLGFGLSSAGTLCFFYLSLRDAYRKQEASLWIAQQAADKMLSRWTDELSGVPQATQLREASLEDAAQLFRALLALKPHDDRSEELAALARFRLSQIFRQQGKAVEAERTYRDAQLAYQGLLKRWPHEPQYLLSLGNVHHGLGQLFADEGKPADAEKEYRIELATLDKIAAPDFDAKQARGRCLNNLAIAVRQQGKREESAALHAQAVAVREELRAQRPDDPNVCADLAASHMNVGVLLADAQRLSEALRAYDAAVEHMEKADLTKPGDRLQLGKLRSNRAATIEKLRLQSERPFDADAAEPEFAAAVATLRKLCADFPQAPAYRFAFAQTLVNAGLELGRRGKVQEGGERLAEAAKELNRLCQEHPEQTLYRTERDDLQKLLVKLGLKAPTE